MDLISPYKLTQYHQFGANHYEDLVPHCKREQASDRERLDRVEFRPPWMRNLQVKPEGTPFDAEVRKDCLVFLLCCFSSLHILSTVKSSFISCLSWNKCLRVIYYCCCWCCFLCGIFVAAVSRKPGEPLVIEEVMVAPPMPHEVRIRIICTSLCHSDITFWKLKV